MTKRNIERKVNPSELLRDIHQTMSLIDDDVDWFIASFSEKDPRRREIARYFADKKHKELVQLAKKNYEKY